MLIGELVKRTGLTKDTIRFYEKKKLISLRAENRKENNYKDYSPAVVAKLLLIRRLKELGFTLNEIDTFLKRWRVEDASCHTLKYTIVDKIAEVNDQLRKLYEIKARLTISLTQCNNASCEFEKTIPPCFAE